MSFKSKLALVPALVMGSVASVHAALPAGVDTAITAAETDGVTLIGLLAAAGAAIFLIGKVLRRFGVMV